MEPTEAIARMQLDFRRYPGYEVIGPAQSRIIAYQKPRRKILASARRA